MCQRQLGLWGITLILACTSLALIPGLGSSGHLTYHEAIWAQIAREMLTGADWLTPRLNGEPWLEKPPLGPWVISAVGWLNGAIQETTARAPSVMSASLLCLGIGIWTSQRFGNTAGAMAGAIQATSLWLVARGRLAEVEVPLACLITWALLLFDRLRVTKLERQYFRFTTLWLFWLLVGLAALGKGIAFGTVLIGAVIFPCLILDQDFCTLRALISPPWWVISLVIGLGWPLFIIGQYPDAAQLWLMHFSDRLTMQPRYFSGEPLLEYILSPFWQTLPWTPLALVGAWKTASRAIYCPGSAERFLWVWALAPLLLVSSATVRNSHYLIYALPPWSVWSALTLTRSIGNTSGEIQSSLFRRRPSGKFLIPIIVSLCWGSGFLLLGSYFDRRGIEWTFYERAGRQLTPEEPLFLLYDTSDHTYQGVSDQVPHDLGIRLFYLKHPVFVLWNPSQLAQHLQNTGGPVIVLSRVRHEQTLKTFGVLKVLLRGPVQRTDRAYALYRIDSQQNARVRISREESVEQQD